MAGIIAVMLALGAQAADVSASIDAAATLHLPPLTWPASENWSPAFKQAYLEHVTGTLKAAENFGLPAMNAPKAVWENFDPQAAEAGKESLNRDLQRYRVKMIETTMAGVRVGILTPEAGIAPSYRRIWHFRRRC